MTERDKDFSGLWADDTDDADEPRTWRGLALAAIMDMDHYAHDETPERRMVSVRAYKDDALRIAAAEGKTPREIVSEEWHRAVRLHGLRPGSVTEEVVARITNRLDGIDPDHADGEGIRAEGEKR